MSTKVHDTRQQNSISVQGTLRKIHTKPQDTPVNSRAEKLPIHDLSALKDLDHEVGGMHVLALLSQNRYVLQS